MNILHSCLTTRQPLVLFLFLQISLFWTFTINGITQDVVFCLTPFTLHSDFKVQSRLQHVSASVPHCFLLPNNIHCMDRLHVTYPFVTWKVVFGVVSSTAVSICVQVLLAWTYVFFSLGVYLGVELLGNNGNYVQILKNYPTFPEWLHSCQHVSGISQVHANIYCFLLKKKLKPLQECEVWYLTVVFDLPSYTDKWLTGHLYIFRGKSI